MNADGRPGSPAHSLVPGRGGGVTEGPVRRAPRRSAVPFVLTWLGVAISLGLLLALARAAEGPLDDRDPAWQRPGFLDAGELPVPAPDVLPGFPSPRRPAVVFFVRADGVGELCHSLTASALQQKAALAVVVAEPASASCEAAGAVVSDPEAALADAYGMRRPRGGGPPVGYAVVDASGKIRYRTLDPEVADQLEEVSTIVAALP
jgi:hypothetical protein